MNRLQAGDLGDSIPGSFFFLFFLPVLQIGSGDHPVSYVIGIRALSPVVKWPGDEADHLVI